MPISQDNIEKIKKLRFIQKCQIVASFFQLQHLPANIFSSVDNKIVFAQQSQIYLMVFEPSGVSKKKYAIRVFFKRSWKIILLKSKTFQYLVRCCTTPLRHSRNLLDSFMYSSCCWIMCSFLFFNTFQEDFVYLVKIQIKIILYPLWLKFLLL